MFKITYFCFVKNFELIFLSTVFDFVLSSKTTNTFPNSWVKTRQNDFYFPKLYNFYSKRATGGLFDYYGMVSKDKKMI